MLLFLFVYHFNYIIVYLFVFREISVLQSLFTGSTAIHGVRMSILYNVQYYIIKC